MACFYDGVEVGGPGGGCENVGFYATRMSNQAIASGVETPVNFTSVMDANPVGVFSTATDLFTSPVEGRYVFTANFEMTIAARGSGYLRWYINGTYNGGASDEGSIATTLTPNSSIVYWLTVGETMQVRAFQNSGFAATLIGCCNQIWFSGALICSP